MCGRIAQATLERVRASARAGDVACERYVASPNASPGARVPVARRAEGAKGDDDDDDAKTTRARCVVDDALWGVARDGRREASNREAPLRWDEMAYNARGEGLRGGRFAALARDAASRCVVYVDGFFEWRVEGPRGKTVRQPYLVRRSDGQAMALAGLIERRAGNDAETAVVTMDSSKGELAWLHDRQPLVLVDDDDFEAWMRDETWATLAEQRKGRDPKMKGVLKWHPVTTRMNVASYQNEDAVKPAKRECEKNAGNIAALFASAGKDTKPKRQKTDEREKQTTNLYIG